MRIFVGGFRLGTSTAEVEKMVARVLRGPWYRLFAPRGQLAECQRLQLVNRQTAISEQCMLLRVSPNRLGWDLVHGLQDASYKGRRLRVHRWLQRSALTDRRVGAPAVQHPAMRSERRGGGERRGRTKIGRLDDDVPLTQPVSGFDRSHGI